MRVHEQSVRRNSLRHASFLAAFLLIAGCTKQQDDVASSPTETSKSDGAPSTATAPLDVSFNEHIRPILSDNCFACHGPDVDNQESPFRLDSEEASRMDLSNEGEAPRYGIVPGDPENSELLQRILHTDPSQQMPPPESKKKEITAKEIAFLRQWILDGAKYEEHWAFVPLSKPASPTVKNQDWVRNELDHFILAQLEARNIAPSPEASPETLVRRVYIDLTGLPPSPEDVDAFLLDKTDTAYESMVDRALASPHYGERMAIDWLDAARYGDSNAIHVDMMRTSWPWRDWVINAFNRNMPYSQFIVEQLAGDLLPNATVDQKVATAFNRNHGITNEGGVIPDEFLVEYAVDRVSTMGSAMMGLTLGCARCHDHKFDPVTMNEFYSLMSFFNNIPEKGLESQSEFDAYAYRPFTYVYTEEEKISKARADEIMGEVNGLKAKKGKEVRSAAGDENAVNWEALTLSKAESNKKKLPAVLSVKTQKSLRGNARNKVVQIQDSKKIHFRTDVGSDATLALHFKGPAAPFNAIRIEATPSLSKGGGEKYGLKLSDIQISEISVEVRSKKTKRDMKLTGGYAALDSTGEGFKQTLDQDPSTSWNLGIPIFEHHFFVQLQEPVTSAVDEVVVRLRFAGGQPVYKFVNDFVFHAGNNPHGYENPVALIPEKERANWHKDAERLQAFNRAGATTLQMSEFVWARGHQAYLNKTATRCMVMEENKNIKPTYVLNRGLYDQPLKDRPRERITPAALPPMPEDAPKNRLGLAQWLVSDEHPLTARFAVNRFWQQLFRHGIVKTSDDFGLQSESPSHPLLLDYLAVDFRENDWNVKRLMKQMVMSATYRQSSRHREALKEFDPDNRLLALAPRYRFPAELIRDNALAASGLLNEQIGGPSVKPYQPDGLWREKTMRPDMNTGIFKRDSGDDLYRRGMYTFWKQAAPPPQMELFDAPSREACVMKRRITTTPLQALLLMNDETYLEIARELATRVFGEVEGDWADALAPRLERGLRLTTGRIPTEDELERWVTFTHGTVAQFAEKPEDAKKFLTQGERPIDASLPEVELAALTFSMSAMLNLDETITRD